MRPLPFPDMLIDGNDEFNAAIRRQWDAVLTLLRCNALSVSVMAPKGSPLFWGDLRMPQLTTSNGPERFIPVYPAADARDGAQPVLVLNLSMAQHIHAVWNLFEFVACGGAR